MLNGEPLAHADLIDDVIVVHIHPREQHLVREIPGIRYHVRPDDHYHREHWVGHLSWATCLALRGVFGKRLEVGDDLAKWALSEKQLRVAPAMALRDVLDLNDLDLGWWDDDLPEEFRPYQRVGAHFLKIAGCAILGDEMRTGKTLQATGALRMLEALPALIVCPNSMKFAWADELVKWWPGVRPAIVRGSAGERRAEIAKVANGEADVAIINWEALRTHTKLATYGSVVRLARCGECGGDGSVTIARCETHVRELNEIPWKAVVADEIHRGKDPHAKQTRALWAVSANATHRFGLTGTPILNSPEDLWALGRFVAPEEWPSKTKFIDRYCYSGWGIYGGLEIMGLREDTKQELFGFLDPRFLRRTRDIVMPWLPPKVYSRRVVDLGPKQRKVYNQMRDEMLAELEDETTYVTNALAKALRLRQFACAYAELEPVEGKSRVRLSEPSCKIDALEEVVEELAGQPAVIFAESKQLINLAGARLEKNYQVGYVTGDVVDQARQDQIDSFQRGDTQLLFVTLGAGGEGLTLSRADIVIFLQRSFSRGKNLQAEDRIVGQTAEGGNEIIDIVAANTIEQRVEEILQEKEELSEEVIRDAETFRRLLGG
jgi:SNF2 family DNA or RNA helicase